MEHLVSKNVYAETRLLNPLNVCPAHICDLLPELLISSVCLWVRALDLYSKVYRTVEPKEKGEKTPK